MATLGTNWPTLLDLASREDPGGGLPIIAEMQNQVNPILGLIPFFPGNLQTGHRGFIRSGLPTAALRELNQGTLPTKTETSPVVDTCAIIEDWGEIDEEVFMLNGGGNAFRMSEDQGKIEAMGQRLASLLFYGNTTSDPKEFLGLSARYADVSAENGGQIIDAGGAQSDNTSIWHCVFDRSTLHGIVPKGQISGLKHEDLGVETKTDSAGRLMRVLRSHYVQKAGIHLKDWEAVARIGSIDVSGIASYDLLTNLISLWYKIPQRLRNRGRRAFFCNSTVKEALVKRAVLNTAGAQPQLTVTQLESGEPMLRFWGVQIYECDAIVNTETVV